ncbi:basic amino acid ABC transporter substrate-binding protein [Lentzea sp. NBRC 105346]|uniref:basic amino acid ABC transporter substrate-binding protein n=1 Tax=Lentzea sp. NBRC 105346 TaxID=3032205 RepID=UPI0024A0B598|nr:basic amino acid ABC transporter substrate-binding protein [Lentzea sp. NBRC 105346]GLZ33151.1 basic amino acid ABC transporter substrate-binding protein [Lentzea sp. NBRC 105346]
MARRTRQVLALIPALGLAVMAATGCATPVNQGSSSGGGDIALVQSGKLVTCTHLSYKPFQYTEGDKTIGFDVDLVDLVAKELNVKQEIFDTPFETITSGAALNTGRCDLAAAGMTITDERKQAIDFSDPYFDATQALLVKKGAPYKSLADLKGKKIGVQQDTTGEKYANDNKAANGYEVVQFEDLPLSETAVRTGAVDAVINDNGVVFDYAKEFPETEVTAEFNTGEQYGIGIKKGNTKLLAKVNEVLKKAKESGEYDKIYEKWFGKKPEKK